MGVIVQNPLTHLFFFLEQHWEVLVLKTQPPNLDVLFIPVRLRHRPNDIQINQLLRNLRFSSGKCIQILEKSAVARASLQHGVVLLAKISNAATAAF